jgi:uncharacterized protein (DUF2235 family)
MGRKIILLSDGTGNSSAKVWRTNVWRVFESLDLTGSGQVAFYDDGVGTSSFKPLAILGGGFGYGLKRNVIDIYKFACRNWRSDDDEIYGFGFSRGAFTMRVVIGLIAEQGLIRADTEAELDRKARAAYRDFRRRNFSTNLKFPETIARWLRDQAIRTKYDKADNFHGATIRFVGLWDTVAAYGMPVEEMTKGISDWIFPLLLPGHKLDKRVVRACHALSIDDERTTFHPVLWDESEEKPLAPRADGTFNLADERISQVWFAGVHSNVGGGYPDDSLAHIPLIWIMNEAALAGLTFKYRLEASPQTLMHPKTVEDKDGRIYDPRSGLGGYYRYGPRDLNTLGKEYLSRGGGNAVPKIHESVLARIRNKAHVYAPNGIPAEYKLVTNDGEILPPAKGDEMATQAVARANLQERAWNIIWWRRIVYFFTVGVSVYLAVFPLMKATPSAAEYETRLRWVSDGVRTVERFLPGAASTWTNGYARQPFRFVLVCLVLIALLWLGSLLARRIQSCMEALWRQSLRADLPAVEKPKDLIFRFRTSPWYVAAHSVLKQEIAPALFAATFFYFGIAVISHALFVVQDDLGMVCKNVLPPHSLHEGKKLILQEGVELTLPPLDISNHCQDLGVDLEANKLYKIIIEVDQHFKNDWIDRDASKGLYLFDSPTLAQSLKLLALLPLRRELFRPWYRIVLRYGSTGGEEEFLDPDPNPETGGIEPAKNSERIVYGENIKPRRGGRLFIFINEAVLPAPTFYGAFYAHNHGTASIKIIPKKDCFVCVDKRDAK